MDPITVQIVRGKCKAIILDMMDRCMKSAYSTIVKESRDLASGIFDRVGRLIESDESPISLGVLRAQVAEIIRRFRKDAKPGDVYIANHPYQACQNHTSDLFVCMPVFDGRGANLIAWVANVAHKPDIGGIVPGTNSGKATDLFQEGVLIPPVKMVDGGVLFQSVMDILHANSRIGDMVVGDTKSQWGALVVGVEGLQELERKYGMDTLTAVWKAWEEKSYEAVINSISKLCIIRKTGVIEDWMDDDGIGKEPVRIAIEAAVTPDGNIQFILDADPQTRGPINLRPCLTVSAAVHSVWHHFNHEVPLNEGIFRAVGVALPEDGTILTPLYPAPVNSYSLTRLRVYGLVEKAIAELLGEERGFAVGSGGNTVISISGPLPSGKRFSNYEIYYGGGGATANGDGLPGLPEGSSIQNTPIESIEMSYPLRLTEYSILTDNMGYGKFRGGGGIRRTWESLGDGITFNIRADRFKFTAKGIFGATDAKPSRAYITLQDGSIKEITSKDTAVALRKGERLTIETAGGGGYGEVRRREREDVSQDIENGFVTKEYAVALIK